MNRPRLQTLISVCLLAALTWPGVVIGATKLVSYAMVRSDATLLVNSRVVRLYGIYVPASGRTCRPNLRPVKCGSNAVLALEFKIRGFVHCETVQKHADRSITALCRNRGVDLSAYLIERGWAGETHGCVGHAWPGHRPIIRGPSATR
jgi:endonuclease YncB( thermonuclease family)